jgi:hypothetical protein
MAPHIIKKVVIERPNKGAKLLLIESYETPANPLSAIIKEKEDIKVAIIKITTYAKKVVSIANLKDFFRNNWLLTQTSKTPTSIPETIPMVILESIPALGINSGDGPRE